MGPRRIGFVLGLVSCFALVASQGFAPAGQIPEACFNCMCEASTDCDLNAECISSGPGKYYCGPYQISYEYWRDAGKPGENPDDPLGVVKPKRWPAMRIAKFRKAQRILLSARKDKLFSARGSFVFVPLDRQATSVDQ
ncbi:lysozyme [Trichonephila inaurata madagascariensis]|uniref:lysozyme n=1 Tax=Trichonephila inaurata madagascariensis TaxID=2747483 RepID=A0A8X6MHN5_9ARAC|nr:lysozyme [Trichonephila inaurata madagascariensis]